MKKEKYYVFCTSAFGEGWYKEFDNFNDAKNYVKDNYSEFDLLVDGTEVEFNYDLIMEDENGRN